MTNLPGNKQQPIFNHAALYVVDFKKSVDFYMGVMGFEPVPEPFKDGRHAWFDIGNGMTLHIIGGAITAREYFRNNHLCFSVASVETFIGVLNKHDVNWYDKDQVKDKITVRPDGVQQVYFQDPDGYWLEVNDDHV